MTKDGYIQVSLRKVYFIGDVQFIIFDIWLNNLMISFTFFFFCRRYWPVATKWDHEDNRSTTNNFEISSSKLYFECINVNYKQVLLRNNTISLFLTTNFKIFQGEYVDCEKIENLYLQSQYVAQAFVHGNSLKVKFIKNRTKIAKKLLIINSTNFCFSVESCCHLSTRNRSDQGIRCHQKNS